MKYGLQKWLPALLTFTLLFALIGCAGGASDTNQKENNPPTDQNVGLHGWQIAPDFTLKTLSDQEVTLSKMRGKKIFLNFWATWCGPCQLEMPDLQKASRTYEQQVTVYGVNITSNDSPMDANKMVIEKRITYPNLLDMTGDVQKAYRVINMPTSFTIDENGVIVERHEGYLSAEVMDQMFQKLLHANKTTTDTNTNKQ